MQPSKRSAVEDQKESSEQLRGTIALELAAPQDHFSDANKNLLRVHRQLQDTALLLATQLAPRTRAYHEVWLDGKAVHDAPAPDAEPLYGKTYLPRKFKTGIALPEDNCIDVYAQDLGLLAVVENGTIVGYNVLVGGGMGMTHGNANTFPFRSEERRVGKECRSRGSSSH